MELKNELIKNISKIHTTKLGIERIKNNLNIKTDNVVEYCTKIIQKKNSNVVKKGKNYYVTYDNIEITINSSSFTIITAHIKFLKVMLFIIYKSNFMKVTVIFN